MTTEAVSVASHREAAQRIIVALDVRAEDEALELVRQLSDHVGLFKIGLGLLYNVGVGIVQKIADLGGRVFLDVKLLDIPNTVAAAMRGIARLPVEMVNLHATGGRAMMREAATALQSEASKLGKRPPTLLAVTVLTSIAADSLRSELGVAEPLEQYVVRLGRAGLEAGCDGLIASPQEIPAITAAFGRSVLIVTPGVRPAWAPAADQKRIMSPREAIERGASYVVVGRPIISPPANCHTPMQAAEMIAAEIEDGLEANRVSS